MYTLPALPYDYSALEPYIDARTMEIHYTKHHQGYVNNLNKALEGYPDWQNMPVEELVLRLREVPEAIRTAVRNNGGGHENHSMFWPLMKKDGGGSPRGPIAQAIDRHFDSFDAFRAEFNQAAKSVFGSGWAWLSLDTDERLVITSTPNQDNPISDGLKPVLGLDVWEHAYYLKYQNKRVDYIDAWWHVINWDQVNENYSALV